MNVARDATPEAFHPDWSAVAPGSIIQRELDARSWSQADLANRMNITKKHLNQVIKQGANFSADFALALERALDVPAAMMLRLEAEWRAARLAADTQVNLKQYTQWANAFPRDVLTKYRVVEKADDEVAVVEKLLRFFGVSDPTAYRKVWLDPQASFKRSEAYKIDANLTALWLQVAARQADAIAPTAPEYDPKKLRRIARTLPGLTRLGAVDAFRKLQDALLGAGVVLVFVPEIQGTRLSGVSLWLPSDRPMIAVTNRYKFADSLWFTLAHEIAHVLMHLKRTTFLDTGADDFAEHIDHHDAPHEAQANAYAQTLLLVDTPQEVLRAVVDAAELNALANELNVDAGVLAGQYGHLADNWRKFSTERRKADLSSLWSPISA